MSVPTATDAMLVCAENADWEGVRRCLRLGANPKRDCSAVLTWAVEHENIVMVKELIPVCNVWAFRNEALRIAHNKKNEEIARLLVPHCDPLDVNSTVHPLDLACRWEWEDVVLGFIDDYDLDGKCELKRMQSSNIPPQSIGWFEALLQQRLLNTVVETTPSVRIKRKI